MFKRMGYNMDKQKTNNSIYIKILIFFLIFSSLNFIFLRRNFIVSNISGISMKPTIYHGDKLLAVKYPSFIKSQLNRGDIILFRSPFNEKYGFGKRVIGLPGDEIRLEEGRVYLNDKLLIEDYTEEGTKTWPTGRYTSWVVPEGEVFVLGDNRQVGGSSDSRSYGCIPETDVTHYLFFRILPNDDRWGYLY